MNDKATGWLCFLLILAIGGDVAYRAWVASPRQSDQTVARLQAFNKAIAAFGDAAFGSMSMNAAPVSTTLKDDPSKMEFIKYQADTMLAFALAYRKTLFDVPTNGVERPQPQDTAGLMREISGLRDEVRTLREEAPKSKGLLPLISATNSFMRSDWALSSYASMTNVQMTNSNTTGTVLQVEKGK